MTVQKFTLYNNNLCPYAARAKLAIAETGHQDVEVIEIDLGAPRPDWYLKVNPYGQVPALKIEDGQGGEPQIVIESLFVAEFVSDLHPEAKLMPTDALQRAQTRYIIHHWGAHTQSIIFKSLFSKDPVEAAKLREDVFVELEKINTLIAQAHAYAATLNEANANGPFFLGHDFTFADLTLAPFLLRLPLSFRLAEDGETVERDFEERIQKLEKLSAWRHAVLNRPCVQNTSPSEEALEDSFRKFLNKH